MSTALLEAAAAVLGPIAADVVVVGAATIGLWITDPAAPKPRATVDVDVVVEVATRARYEAYAARLWERGFTEDTASGHDLPMAAR